MRAGERYMRKPICLMIIILSFGIALAAIPAGYSYYCTVQVDTVDIPNSVTPGQSFQVTTHVTASCPAQLPDFTSVRVDIVEAASNQALSTGEFATGYSFAHSGGSVSGVVTGNLNAPSMTGPWSLLAEALFYRQSYLMSAAQQPITIQVGSAQPPGPSTTIPILQNGGFENGTANWQLLQGSSGYDSVSTSIVHSGLRALATTVISPPPGSNLLAPTINGVSQTASLSSISGLTMDAWYVTQILSSQVAARVRVRINGLTLNYYVKFGPLTQATSGDTDTSKSLFVSNWDCVSWCELSRDVGADFRTMFSAAAIGSIFGPGPVTVTVALELLGYGILPTSQFIFWDDVQFNAQVPVPTTSQTTFVVEPTSTVESTTTSQALASTSQETATQATALASAQTTTEAVTTPLSQNGPFAIMDMSALLVAIVVVIIVAVAVGFILLRRKGTGTSRRDMTVAKGYCTNCGKQLPGNTRFCPECGSGQRG
jgi:hypothetical protein